MMLDIKEYDVTKYLGYFSRIIIIILRTGRFGLGE